MTLKLRVPGHIESVCTKFFGRFTPKDLIRLLSPVSLGMLLTHSQGIHPVLLAITVGVGVVWYGFTPYEKTLDQLLIHAVRWTVESRYSDPDHTYTLGPQYVETDTGTLLGVIKISPVNVEMLTEDEQRAVHGFYQELLDTVTYPIQIYSVQQPVDLSTYVEHLSEHTSKQQFEEYRWYCRYLSNRTEITTTHHYIGIRVSPHSQHRLHQQLYHRITGQPAAKSHETLQNELESRCREVTETLSSSELTTTRLTGDQLTEFIDHTHSGDPSPRWTSHPDTEDDEYLKTLYITELPKQVNVAWILQALRTDGYIDTVQIIRPRDSAATVQKLQRRSERLNAEIESFLRQGYAGTNKLESLLEDVEWLLNRLADRDTLPVDHAIYITVRGTTRHDCLKTYERVRNRLNTLQIEFEEPVFRTDYASQTISPLSPDALDESLLMPSSGAAAGFPFGTQDTNQETGIIYGVDTNDETPVLLDRYSWPSYSMVRMGTTGSGKSYAVKQELLRTRFAYPNTQLIVIDPKKEYRQIIDHLGGTVTQLQPNTTYAFDHGVIGFEVADRGQQDNIRLLLDLLEQLYAAVSQTRQKTVVVIDEAHTIMRRETGRQLLSQFVREARDTNTAITLISQNAGDFTEYTEGKAILDNIPGKVFMRHERVPESTVDFFNLSIKEKTELQKLRTGTDTAHSEAIVKVSGQIDTKIRIESTPTEHRIIDDTTDTSTQPNPSQPEQPTGTPMRNQRSQQDSTDTATPDRTYNTHSSHSSGDRVRHRSTDLSTVTMPTLAPVLHTQPLSSLKSLWSRIGPQLSLSRTNGKSAQTVLANPPTHTEMICFITVFLGYIGLTGGLFYGVVPVMVYLPVVSLLAVIFYAYLSLLTGTIHPGENWRLLRGEQP